MVVQGYSRGTEPAMLLGQHHPGLIHGVIVYSPTWTVVPALPDQTKAAWTLHGHLIAQKAIPLDHLNGPLLAIAGGDDQLWTSEASTRLIMGELDHDRFPHRALTYPLAGHGVGVVPYYAAGTKAFSRLTNSYIGLGGGRAGDAAAKEQDWPQVLAFLARLT